MLVSRHFDEDYTLYTDPSEKDLEIFVNNFENELNSETIQLIKEIIEIKKEKTRNSV